MVKGALGAALGVAAPLLVPALGLAYFAALTLALYIVASLTTIGVAKRARPPLNVYAYALLKGSLTYYLSLYLAWTALHAALSSR